MTDLIYLVQRRVKSKPEFLIVSGFALGMVKKAEIKVDLFFSLQYSKYH